MNPIKFNDPVLGKLDELLGGGIFRTEKRVIGPEVTALIKSNDRNGVRKLLTELGDLKTVSPESIAATPVLAIATFAILAEDKINTRLAKTIEVPRNHPKISLQFADIMLLACTSRASAETSVAVINGRVGLDSNNSAELIDHICNLVEYRQTTAIFNRALEGDNPLERLLEEWRTGETMIQRLQREQAEDDAKAKAAADRRRQRQHAAGFNDEDIEAGLADEIK